MGILERLLPPRGEEAAVWNSAPEDFYSGGVSGERGYFGCSDCEADDIAVEFRWRASGVGELVSDEDDCAGGSDWREREAEEGERSA